MTEIPKPILEALLKEFPYATIYSPAPNVFTHDWESRHVVLVNEPIPEAVAEYWARKGNLERDRGVTSIMVLPVATSKAWWQLCIKYGWGGVRPIINTNYAVVIFKPK